jgi:hypothetical protein
MPKRTYGKNNQITFNSPLEEQEAINFLRKRSTKGYIEPNQLSGARAEEHRFRFGVNEDIPDSLNRQLTAGRRINCKELYNKVYNESDDD